MKKKNFILIMIVMILVNLTSCKNKYKENILLNDVKNQTKVEEQEIRTAIDNGNKYLEKESYEKAVKWYEKTISMGVYNRDTYIYK